MCEHGRTEVSCSHRAIRRVREHSRGPVGIDARAYLIRVERRLMQIHCGTHPDSADQTLAGGTFRTEPSSAWAAPADGSAVQRPSIGALSIVTMPPIICGNP